MIVESSTKQALNDVYDRILSAPKYSFPKTPKKDFPYIEAAA